MPHHIFDVGDVCFTASSQRNSFLGTIVSQYDKPIIIQRVIDVPTNELRSVGHNQWLDICGKHNRVSGQLIDPPIMRKTTHGFVSLDGHILNWRKVKRILKKTMKVRRATMNNKPILKSQHCPTQLCNSINDIRKWRVV